MDRSSSSSSSRPWAGEHVVWSGVALLLGLGAVVAAYVWSVHLPRTIAGLRAGGSAVGGVELEALEGRVAEVERGLLLQPLVVAWQGGERSIPRGTLGVSVDRAALVSTLKGLGRSGDPWRDLGLRVRARRGLVDVPLPLVLDRTRALERLSELKDDVDRAPGAARLDLEHHRVAAATPGYLMRVYDSLVALEYAVEASAPRVELVVSKNGGEGAAALGDIDIGTVLGFWETHYSSTGVDSDRTYNLKVGADHLNGHILQPHEIFSFNQVVGDRTEKEGYRVAPVIQSGELIDGLAGGMCQIASTLHAAAFFAGLEIVSSTPHSRPSAYIPMGLDSTVVYPSVDLKLRNPYDFPVVMHYQVNQGSVKVELLGKERPYRVLFEREIKSETPFESDGRSDPEMPSSQHFVVQEGYPGYTLTRRRFVFGRGKLPRYGGTEPTADLLEKQGVRPVKMEQWSLRYPATTQYVVTGSGASSLKKKEPPPSHHIPTIPPGDKPFFKLLK